MVAAQDLTVTSLRNWSRLRNFLVCAIFAVVVWVLSDASLSRGLTSSILLVLGLILVGLCTLIFWRPVIGLYTGVLLNIAMDGQVPGDPISKYTAYFHENLNTFAHAGVAFSPLELLFAVTTLAYLLRTASGMRLQGGTLAKPVLVFGLFLAFGFVWGYSHGGDCKIGLFEARGPFLLVMLYFLVTNLIRDERQLAHLLTALETGLGILSAWTTFRLFVFLHGHSGGADGALGVNHEDAVFLGYYAVICLLRMVSPGSRKRPFLLLMALLSVVLMLEMQRRAASVCLVMALVVLAIVLFYRRRHLFLRLAPIAALLIVLYCGAFWNSNSTWAQPIRAIRTSSASSSVNARDNSSDLYRVAEKANVRDTIKAGPLTGVGFGRKYLETHPVMHFADFQFQFYTPHAEVLWIWLKIGAVGFAAFWVLVCLALMRAGSLISRLGTAPLGFSCLVGILYVAMLLTFSYVDIGLANIRCEMMLGTALGIVGTATDLWRRQAISRRPSSASRLGSSSRFVIHS